MLQDMLYTVSQSCKPGKVRGHQERAQAMELIIVFKRFTRTHTKTIVLLLSEKPFIAWRCREELMSLPEATALWKTKCKPGSGALQKIEHGVMKIGVQGHTELVQESGQEASARLVGGVKILNRSQSKQLSQGR